MGRLENISVWTVKVGFDYFSIIAEVSVMMVWEKKGKTVSLAETVEPNF